MSTALCLRSIGGGGIATVIRISGLKGKSTNTFIRKIAGCEGSTHVVFRRPIPEDASIAELLEYARFRLLEGE